MNKERRCATGSYSNRVAATTQVGRTFYSSKKTKGDTAGKKTKTIGGEGLAVYGNCRKGNL